MQKNDNERPVEQCQKIDKKEVNEPVYKVAVDRHPFSPHNIANLQWKGTEL